jgi:hypothetical protein
MLTPKQEKDLEMLEELLAEEYFDHLPTAHCEAVERMYERVGNGMNLTPHQGFLLSGIYEQATGRKK